MRLMWRDAAGTLAVAAALALYWAFLAGLDLPLVSGPRVLAVVVFGFGVAACVLGGGNTPAGTARGVEAVYRRLFGVHGAIAFALTLIVLITASRAVLGALIGLVVLVWLVTTVRRGVVTALGRHRAADDRQPQPGRSGGR